MRELDVIEPGTLVKVAGTPEWLTRILAEYLRLGTLFPAAFLAAEDCPDWVKRVDREVARSVFPVAKLKEGESLTPKRVAALLGHSCAYAVWMMEALQSATDGPAPPANSQAKTTAEIIARVDERDLTKATELLDIMVSQYYPGLCRLAKRALCWSVNGTYTEMSEFLLAFANAFAKKPRRMGMPDLGSNTFKIYLILLCGWRLVQHLDSVAQLHAILVNGLGAPQVGDLKRIEKICQRIGLSFRKPGRPRKPREIQTS